MTLSNQDPRQSLIDASIDAEIQRINVGTTGNMSIRADGGMFITPSGIPPRELAPDLIVAMDLDGHWSGNVKPSSEWALHSAIYKARPEIAAAVHAHSDHCVALSCARLGLPAFHYMIAGFGGDDVRCSRYATFGSPDLADATIEAMEDRTACLLANHGMVTAGSTLSEAYGRALKLETLARQYMLCRSFAEPVLLNENELVDVKKRYTTYGRQDALKA